MGVGVSYIRIPADRGYESVEMPDGWMGCLIEFFLVQDVKKKFAGVDFFRTGNFIPSGRNVLREGWLSSQSPPSGHLPERGVPLYVFLADSLVRRLRAGVVACQLGVCEGRSAGCGLASGNLTTFRNHLHQRE